MANMNTDFEKCIDRLHATLKALGLGCYTSHITPIYNIHRLRVLTSEHVVWIHNDLGVVIVQAIDRTGKKPSIFWRV